MATRRPNDFLQDRLIMDYNHGALTASTAVKLHKVASGQKLRLDRATVINPTGLAVDVTNFMNIRILMNGTDESAAWSTETGQEGALVADTFAEMPLSATAANLVADAGDVITLDFVEGGAVTLPAGRVVLEFSRVK